MSVADIQGVFEAVRKACAPGLWSRGVELSRADAVLGERSGPDEIVVRVSTKGGMIARSVTLFPEDEAWECSCGAAGGCEHAAAAVIALKRAREEGRDLPTPRSVVGRVVYRFTRTSAGLALERGIVAGGTFHTLEATLAALATGRVDGPAFAASQADLNAELVLGTHRRGVLPKPLVAKTLAALAGCDDVTLDGVPVKTAAAPVLPRVLVEDQDDAFRVTLRDDPGVTEVFRNGAALCDGELRPAGEAALTGLELHELSRGKRFGPADIADLVTDVLPSLRRRVPVDVITSRLPRTVEEPPRAVVETSVDGHRLSVLATVVYGDPPIARIDGGRLVHLQGPVPMRDERAEQRLVRRLSGELGLAPGIRSEFEGEAAVVFGARLDAWKGEVRGPARESFRRMPALAPRVRVEGERLDVLFEVPASAGGRGASAEAGGVLRAWREGASLVPLDGGGWSPIPADWLSRFGDRIADLLAARDVEGRLPRCAAADLARLCEDLDLPVPPSFDGLRSLFEGFAGIPPAPLPGDLTGSLRPYQRSGVDWLCFLRDAGLGGLLADDMGLGKTLQALCAVRGRTLVVAPTSVMHNWADEIRRFRPALRALVYHGPRRKLDPQADVTITSYAILRLDEDLLAAEPWDGVVLDEAQTIKNPDSQAAAAAYRLRAGFRLALSGTPVENRLDELWSQFHFANRGLLGGRRDFQDRYARPIAEGRADVAARLRERIRPFLLRRLKREVAPELPPRTEATLYCVLSEEERRIYEAVAAATREEVVRKLQEGGNVLAALEALLRLRQAACHPALVPGQQAETSSKIQLLLDRLETVLAEGHKALVFSQWTSMLDLIEPHLAAASVEHLRLDGSTTDRAGLVARFQDEAGPPVFLVSLKAGGTGLNLTAADHVFLMDPWWNPAVEDQAADRAHRIGQDRPVMIYRMVAEETVEEKILVLQEAKRAIAGAALGEGGRATAITREELLALFG